MPLRPIRRRLTASRERMMAIENTDRVDVCRCGHTRREHYDYPTAECSRCPCVDPQYTDYLAIFRSPHFWSETGRKHGKEEQ